jgi:hypothetical protein
MIEHKQHCGQKQHWCGRSDLIAQPAQASFHTLQKQHRSETALVWEVRPRRPPAQRSFHALQKPHRYRRPKTPAGVLNPVLLWDTGSSWTSSGSPPLASGPPKRHRGRSTTSSGTAMLSPAPDRGTSESQPRGAPPPMPPQWGRLPRRGYPGDPYQGRRPRTNSRRPGPNFELKRPLRSMRQSRTSGWRPV